MTLTYSGRTKDLEHESKLRPGVLLCVGSAIDSLELDSAHVCCRDLRLHYVLHGPFQPTTTVVPEDDRLPASYNRRATVTSASSIKSPLFIQALTCFRLNTIRMKSPRASPPKRRQHSLRIKLPMVRLATLLTSTKERNSSMRPCHACKETGDAMIKGSKQSNTTTHGHRRCR